MSFNAFISYSTQDLEAATHVKRLLESTGSSVYLAEYSAQPGASLPNDILAAIRGCDLFLLLWSQNARASDWVPQEIGVAKAAERPMLPLALQSGASLPGFIQDLKYLPLYKEPEAALTWLRDNVYQRVQKKAQVEGLVWLGLGAAVIWLLARSEG